MKHKNIFFRYPCALVFVNLIGLNRKTSDIELVEQLTENPYYQYFIGLSGYQQEVPFAASVLVSFRK